MKNIKHLYQPDGISCGSTCLKMIQSHINDGEITIEDIKKIVGTNKIKGTTLEDMIVGLNHMSIKHEVPTLNNEQEAVNYLNQAMKEGCPVIVRTLTKGVKHWIIANGFDGKTYDVQDPWLGIIKYTIPKMVQIWQPRDFHCIKILKQTQPIETLKEVVRKIIKENLDGVTIRKMKPEDKEQVTNLTIQAFKHVMSPSDIREYNDEVTNYDKSIVAEKDGKIVGAYLLGDRQLRSGCQGARHVAVDLDDYDKKKGIEGVALAVDPSVKGTGVGKKLKDYTRTLGYDYIWGLQLKSLKNLDHWLKRRKLAAQGSGMYVTVEDFK